MTACEPYADSLPDFVLGTAPAEDRAAIVEHVGSCVACTQRVAAWRVTTDRLVSLAPTVEPAAGFEARALASFSAEPRRAPRRGPLAIAAVIVLLVGACLGGFAVQRQLADDRRLATAYRAQLDEADGEYFAARRMSGVAGATGVAFVYQGEPSWVLVTTSGTGSATAVVVHARDGQVFSGTLHASESGSSFGSALPFDAHAITTIEVRADDGTPVLAATIHA